MTVPRRRRVRSVPVVLYAHPFELCLGIVLVLAGARSLVEASASPASLDPLPDVVLIAWQLGSIVGGLAVLVGILGRTRPIMRAVEKAGLYLIAGVASAYAFALVTSLGNVATFAAAQLAATAVASVLRALAIRKTERVVLESLRAVNAGAVDPAVILDLVDGRPPRRGR